MVGILFVCHGNICRSPMAEFVLKDLAARAGRAVDFFIASAATSTEEIGNGVHRGTREKLRREGVPFTARRAAQFTPDDYARYDLILAMDGNNLRNLLRMTGGDPLGKVKRLLDFSDRPRDIADPWYTGDFDTTYDDVCEGCAALLSAEGKKGI